MSSISGRVTSNRASKTPAIRLSGAHKYSSRTSIRPSGVDALVQAGSRKALFLNSRKKLPVFG
ncbi:MAG TPA: hypothetical protein DCS07_07655 [Bdellovibrionales bacterium]|nr:hypothetical protein [Bdellovibrionales bacterium]